MWGGRWSSRSRRRCARNDCGVRHSTSLFRDHRPRHPVAQPRFAAQHQKHFDREHREKRVSHRRPPPAAALAARRDQAQAEEALAEGAAAVAVAKEHGEHEHAQGGEPDQGDGLHRAAEPGHRIADDGRGQNEQNRDRQRVDEEGGDAQERRLGAGVGAHLKPWNRDAVRTTARFRMNSRGRKIYSLLALALAGCVVRGERHVAEVHKSWPSAAIKRIEVREVDGAINVHGGATDKVLLDARIRSFGKEKPEEFRADIDGDTLVIGRRDRHRVHIGFFDWADTRIDYDLTVPSNVELKLTTVNGKIMTRGVAGETAANTVNGSLDLETDGTKEVTAKSVNGRIVRTFTKDFQGATFKTVNGRVIAVLPSSASFYGDFTQVNGGKYERKITTVNGDIKVENLGGIPVPAAPAAPPAPNAIPTPPAGPVPVAPPDRKSR